MQISKPKVLYLCDLKNIHHQRFISALSEYFQVHDFSLECDEISINQYDVIIVSPINLKIPDSILDSSIKKIGISLAYDLMESRSHDGGSDYLTRNLNHLEYLIVDSDFSLNRVVSEFGYTGKITKMIYGYDPYPNIREPDFNQIKIFVSRNWTEIHSNGVILSALSELHSKGIDFSANFIGEGPQKEVLLKKFSALISDTNIQVYGFLQRSELEEVRSRSWMSISASASDGTSISLLESMSSGQICITTNFPSNLEVIDNGIDGFTFPLGDHQELAKLIMEISNLPKENLTKISASAKSKSQKMGDWATNKKVLINLVSEIIS